MTLVTERKSTSGLSWQTLQRYRRSGYLERDQAYGDPMFSGEPVYMHRRDCAGWCEFGCNGEHGFRIADDVAAMEAEDDAIDHLGEE